MLNYLTNIINVTLVICSYKSLYINTFTESLMKLTYMFYPNSIRFHSQIKCILYSSVSEYKYSGRKFSIEKNPFMFLTLNELNLSSFFSKRPFLSTLSKRDDIPGYKRAVGTNSPRSSKIPNYRQVTHILKYPHKCLRSINYDLTIDDIYLSPKVMGYNIEEMFRIMYENSGVGIAAPQIGINKRLFVYNPSGDSKKWMQEIVMINPKIIEFSNGKEIGKEGCLSFPNKECIIERSRWIKVEYYDRIGKKKKRG